MNIWLTAEIVFLCSFLPCLWCMLRCAEPGDWVVALQMAGTIAVLVLLLLAQAMSRPSFYDLALALALLSFPASLLFAHYLEHWC